MMPESFDVEAANISHVVGLSTNVEVYVSRKVYPLEVRYSFALSIYVPVPIRSFLSVLR